MAQKASIRDTFGAVGGGSVTPHDSNAQPACEGVRALNIQNTGTVVVEYDKDSANPVTLYVAGGIAFPCGNITRIKATGTTASVVTVLY